MKLLLKKGAASQTALVFIQDSTSTTGAGKTGLLYTTSGLTWYYYREAQGTGGTQVTLADMTLGTWASGGFKEVDATDMPGWYEIGIPNAALVTGADFVGMTLRGATGMADCALEIQLLKADLGDALFDVLCRVAGGTKVDVGDNTIKVYDGDPATANLLYTLTRSVAGDEYTTVRS